MSKEQALALLIEAVELGQRKGSYSLNEARLIASAVEVINNKNTNMNDQENENTVAGAEAVPEQESIGSTVAPSEAVSETPSDEVAGEADLAPSAEVPE